MDDLVGRARALAAAYATEARALPRRHAESERAICRRYARLLRREPADLVLAMAEALLTVHGERGLAYDLIHAHRGAMARLDAPTLEAFGRGINAWWSVDHFARYLSGPAWREGQVADEVILCWAGSVDRWWRRTALVSTVPLNVRSQGGRGDVPRTLAVCRLLAADRDDMVAKALSWALRELVVHDPAAVWAFLAEHDALLPALVKREVRNKLTTGLKNPGRGRQRLPEG